MRKRKSKGRSNVLDNYDDYMRKIMRSIRKYFMWQYKQIVFDVFPNCKKDGTYKITLDVDKKIEKIYGKFEFDLVVENGTRRMNNITYERLLKDGYMRELPTRNGIIYSDENDLNKIKIMEFLYDNK